MVSSQVSPAYTTEGITSWRDWRQCYIRWLVALGGSNKMNGQRSSGLFGTLDWLIHTGTVAMHLQVVLLAVEAPTSSIGVSCLSL